MPPWIRRPSVKSAGVNVRRKSRLQSFYILLPHASSLIFWPIELHPAPLVLCESSIERLVPWHGQPQLLLIICTELTWMKNIGSVRIVNRGVLLGLSFGI